MDRLASMLGVDKSAKELNLKVNKLYSETENFMLVVRNLIHQKKLLSNQNQLNKDPKEENLDAEFESKSKSRE
jgi:hypothetical protein